MIEPTGIMLCVTIGLSVWAYFAWMKVARARQLRRLDGRAEPLVGDDVIASQLLVLIVIVDVIAASFALL
jgi:hypothetical protein